MSELDDIAAALQADAGLTALDVAVTLDLPWYTVTPALFQQVGGRARIKRVIYLKGSRGTQDRAEPTGYAQFLHLLCYAPTGREADAIERAARPVLHDQQIGGLGIRFFDWLPADLDRQYDPREWVTLGRYRALGLWGGI